jgi:AcrR family transcriptional regulator
VEQDKASKRQVQADATRRDLVAAAAGVFAARGYQATTVAAITKAASTGHGTFYLYFRNKEDIFATVVEGITLELYDRTWTAPISGSMEEIVELTVRSFLDMFASHSGIWRCLLEGAFTNPTIEAMWRELRAGFVSRTARWLRQLQEAGAIRAIDPDLAANALGSMVEWVATTQFVLHMDPVADASLDETAEVLGDLWCRALAVGVPAPGPDAVA